MPIDKDLVEAADSGVPEAQLVLGYLYLYGHGAEKNAERAKGLLNGVKHDLPFADYLLGILHSMGDQAPQDWQQAVAHYQRAADAGIQPAIFALAGCYENGLGVAQALDEAFELVRNAAEGGYRPAQSYLALMYAEGVGTSRCAVKAFEWYLRAAKAGDCDAACHVARMYESGEGAPADAALALSWYQKSARMGHWAACERLALAYRKGQLGLLVDVNKSAEYDRAALQASERLPQDLT